MSAVAARPLLRSSARLGARRFQSTTTQKAAEATKEAASDASSKAAQGLSRVTSSAAGAARGVGNALSKVGGRTGRLVGFVEKQLPTVIYYSKVGAEVTKIVFRGQKMAPPPLSTFQSYFGNAAQSLKNPSALLNTASQTASSAASTATQQPTAILQRLRNLNKASLVAGGVVAAECLGFFTVGEMIGRFKLVGYHGETHAAH
ncbi:ATP synthase subunit G [Plectosphaerella plurivora]|uniref:ATP synthase subunit G n=1 Tax=Plectosphaerella plurivora TaxID=936078 RepID=A0A9P9AEB9_9PEZI|nr:ATP synthase subunit G [Plectosphaerella plurivora]